MYNCPIMKEFIIDAEPMNCSELCGFGTNCAEQVRRINQYCITTISLQASVSNSPLHYKQVGSYVRVSEGKNGRNLAIVSNGAIYYE